MGEVEDKNIILDYAGKGAKKTGNVLTNEVNILITILTLLGGSGGYFGVKKVSKAFWEPAKAKFQQIDERQEEAIEKADALAIRLDVIISILCGANNLEPDLECVEVHREAVVEEKVRGEAMREFE